MTLTDAATLLGLARSTLLSQVRNGKLRARKDRRGEYRVRAREVERYRAESRGKPGRKPG